MSGIQCDRGVRRTARDQREGGGSLPARSLFVHYGMVEDAMALVLSWHYTRRWPAAVQLVATLHLSGGLFGSCGKCVAACVFGIPPTRWSIPVLELTRLVRGPDRVPLSFLVARACKRLAPKWPLVVSFADVSEGHHGGVYQACGWNYHGFRETRSDGIEVDGMFVPGRSANGRWGTRSPAKLAALGIDAKAHIDSGKHLYWRVLNRAGLEDAQTLGLESNPYPKRSVELEAEHAKADE